MSELTDEEFLGYCLIHGETERHLFSGAQVRRLLALAGEQDQLLHEDSWYPVYITEVRPLVDAARARKPSRLRDLQGSPITAESLAEAADLVVKRRGR